jgi:hypothetical protein
VHVSVSLDIETCCCPGSESTHTCSNTKSQALLISRTSCTFPTPTLFLSTAPSRHYGVDDYLNILNNTLIRHIAPLEVASHI